MSGLSYSSSVGGWPNFVGWSALKSGVTVATPKGERFLWAVECGELALPSGRLVVCDPFVSLAPLGMPFVETPRGRFRVVVTLVDVSAGQDRSHVREAYGSVIFSDGVEVTRRALALAVDEEEPLLAEGEEFVGFTVAAGAVCFVDETLIGPGMPDARVWFEEIFENEREDSWFARMDDPEEIREGIANVRLPLGKEGENLVLFHSGWGDGVYPVVGGYDASGELVAVHVDLFVVM